MLGASVVGMYLLVLWLINVDVSSKSKILLAFERPWFTGLYLSFLFLHVSSSNRSYVWGVSQQCFAISVL